MYLKNCFYFTTSESVAQCLEKAKKAIEESLNPLINRVEKVSDDWKQTATQGTQNAIDKFTDTVEQAKGSLEQNLEQITVQTVFTSSVTDWFEQHSAFLRIIKTFNWSINHPIISLIIILFALAIFWSLIKAITHLIESASLSILQIPVKLLQALIKFCWLFIGKFSNFAHKKFTDEKTVDKTLKIYRLQQNTASQRISDNKQQRLKDISLRLAEIQLEQQELLQEAADILDTEKINHSVI